MKGSFTTQMFQSIEGNNYAESKLVTVRHPINEIKDDMTFLMHAVKSNNVLIIKLLIDKDANVNTQDCNGKTPLMVVCEQSGNVNIVQLLIDKGANVNTKDSSGKTSLMFACAQKPGTVEIVELLLSMGARVNIKDREDQTALDLLPKGMTGAIKKLLIEALKSQKKLEDIENLSSLETSAYTYDVQASSHESEDVKSTGDDAASDLV